MQGVRFGVAVYVQLLGGRAQGVWEWGWTVAREARGRGWTGRHWFGGRSNRTLNHGCPGVKMAVRERVKRTRGRGRWGRRRRIRGGRPLLLRGGIGITGVGPNGRTIIWAAMIKISVFYREVNCWRDGFTKEVLMLGKFNRSQDIVVIIVRNKKTPEKNKEANKES